MRSQFLEKLIKTYPNYYQLGQAVSTYYLLREKKLTKENFNLLQSVIRSGTRELDSVHNKIEADLNARKG